MSLILLLALLVLIVIFAVQNSLPVTLTFFVWHLDASLAVVVAVCFALGMIISALALTPRMLRRRAHVKKLQSQLDSRRESPTKNEVSATP